MPPLDSALREMIGDPMANAVDAARVATGNDSVMVRCAEGLWRVEVDDDPIAAGLSHDDAVDVLATLA